MTGYHITPEIVRLVAAISEKTGMANAWFMDDPSPVLARKNMLRSVYASLNLAGNSLRQDQILALAENKPLAAPKKDVLEAANAIHVYGNLRDFDPFSVSSFKKAHQLLLAGLTPRNGKFRKSGTSPTENPAAFSPAPPAETITQLTRELFDWLKHQADPVLIKSCMAHQEIIRISPFEKGNGRMGRLWQKLILIHEYPVLEFVPYETVLKLTQAEYLESLSESEKTKNSTAFAEYLLNVIDRSLSEFLGFKNKLMKHTNRLEYFLTLGKKRFSRKDYMDVFKDISTATASRDLRRGTEMGLFEKSGDKNITTYSSTD